VPTGERAMNQPEPLRLAVLLSGGGRTLQYIHDGIRAGDIPASIEIVISSRADAYGVTRATGLGCDTRVIDRKSTSQDRFDRAITAAVSEAEVDLVCMAGFLCFWRIPPAFQNRVMNIHPALLPRFGGRGFYGHRVHEAVLVAGCDVSGCTVHYCDNQYDHGPVILQRTVPVRPDDTPESLADRVFQQEMIAYPEAIRLHAAGRLRVAGDRVETLPPG
jgi:phosphoribosylglycinamide formyltransferase-1